MSTPVGGERADRASVVDHGDPVGYPGDFVQVVAGDQDAGAPGGPPESDSRSRITPAGSSAFVGSSSTHGGVVLQRRRRADPLAVTQRQPSSAPGRNAEVELLDHDGHLFVGPAGRDAVQPHRDPEVRRGR